MANQNRTTDRSNYTSSSYAAFWLVFFSLGLAIIARVTMTADMLPVSAMATGALVALIILYFAYFRNRLLTDVAKARVNVKSIRRQLITEDERIMNAFWRSAMRDMPYGHYVYLIRDIDVTGAYKIGRTSYPSQRMTDFGAKLPFEIAIVRIIQCSDSRQLERELHQRFAHKRLSGEWFALSAADVTWLKQLEVA